MASNEVREFRFHRASLFQPSTTEPNQNYNTQRAPRSLGAERCGVGGGSKGLEEVNAKVNKRSWKIPWTEEPGRLQSMGSQRVGHD